MYYQTKIINNQAKIQMQRPQAIKLSYPEHLSPKLFGIISSGGYNGIVDNENSVTVEGEAFASNDKLVVGSTFLISAGSHNALLYYQNEIDEYNAYCEEKRKSAREKLEEDRKRCIEKQRTESLEFWAKHNLPFKFTLDIKEALSGLSANSNGCGMKRNTVFHVYLHEDFEQGKLKRKKGDFLCSQVKSKTGGNWSGTIGSGDCNFDTNGIKRVPTCKKCIELISKINKL